MKIKQVYVGGWFQRTTLHLSEIYDFIREGYTTLDLDHHKLKKLQQGLEVRSDELKIDGLEYIALTTTSDTRIKIFEDGLIILGREYHAGEVSADIKWLTDYYEKKFSPALSYLFSLGAPVPKELANIKDIYPYFVVVEDASREDLERLLNSFGQKKYFEVVHPRFDIFRGDKFYLINNKKEKPESIERFIEEQIFLREFKAQLHRYLNLHRIIWERIAQVKERGTMRGRDVGDFKSKIEGYAKTINLIEARINQMGSYLHTRERRATNDKELKDFLSVIGYRYETLGDTLEYVREIWTMTKNYVSSALDLFGDVQDQATQTSVENLTIVTSVGVGATLIGLFATDVVPSLSGFGVSYFFILAAVGFAASRAIQWFYMRKTYDVSDEDYDKDIK